MSFWENDKKKGLQKSSPFFMSGNDNARFGQRPLFRILRGCKIRRETTLSPETQVSPGAAQNLPEQVPPALYAFPILGKTVSGLDGDFAPHTLNLADAALTRSEIFKSQKITIFLKFLFELYHVKGGQTLQLVAVTVYDGIIAVSSETLT